MARSNIISLLKERKQNASKIAGKLRVSRQSVYKSMDGKGSQRIRVFISKVLNRSPLDLWFDLVESGDMSELTLRNDDYFYNRLTVDDLLKVPPRKRISLKTKTKA